MFTRKTGVLIGAITTALCLTGCGDDLTQSVVTPRVPAVNAKNYIADSKVEPVGDSGAFEEEGDIDAESED